MQYAVFVYISSAKAVIQDLFLFLFKTKTVSGANRTSRERNEHLIMGKEKSTNKDLSDSEDLIEKEKSLCQLLHDFRKIGGADVGFGFLVNGDFTQET